MDLQPPGAPLPGFFAAVRRRHPDVDIVLLPPELPVPEGTGNPPQLAEEAEVVATLGRVATCADLQWSRVLGGTRDPAEARIRFGPRPGTVVAAARHSAEISPDLAPLDRLEGFLAADGWQWRSLDGDAVRLVGERQGLHLTASYAPATGVFVLEVVGDPLLVGVGRAQGAGDALMQMISGSVGRASRAWDQQHLDLAGAAGRIGEAPTAGFTDGVAGAAARFTAAWSRHAGRLAGVAEARADGLRQTVRDFLETDGAVGLDALALRGYLTEPR